MSSIVKKNAGEVFIDDVRCGMVRKNISNFEDFGKKAKIGRSAMYDRKDYPGDIKLGQLPYILRAAGIKEITIRASDTFTMKRRNKK